jgi:hypothetical protein
MILLYPYFRQRMILFNDNKTYISDHGALPSVSDLRHGGNLVSRHIPTIIKDHSALVVNLQHNHAPHSISYYQLFLCLMSPWRRGI